MEIGDKLKAFRLQSGMTLVELSRGAGVSKSMLSRIERNDSAPTVTTLGKIASALGVDVAAFFDDSGAHAGGRETTASSERGAPPSARDMSLDRAVARDGHEAVVSIVRCDQRKKVSLPWGADYEMLCPDMQRRIEFIFITYPVSGGSGDLYSHDGEECGVVVEGRFRGVVGDQEFFLEPGDSVYYASTIPHRWENAGDVEAKAVWAITPPSFLTGKITHQ